MKKILTVLVLGAGMFAFSAHGALAATMHETIHLKPASMSSLAKASGTAKVTYTKQDVTIHLTTDNLPMPSAIHASKYYAVWLKAGSKSWYVGDLKLNGHMGGVSKMLMLQKFQDVTVTAEKSPHPMHAVGTLVLSGMSARH
jgi:hypothetical protein